VAVPAIAAICGGCAGAGFFVASYVDIRFADSGAKIACSFAALGLPAEDGLGWLLARIVGPAKAAQLLDSPAPVTAARAGELGWVQHVSVGGDVVADAVGYARSLARGSSAQSLEVMKRQVFVDSTLDFGEAYSRSVADMDTALTTADFKH